MRRGPSSSAWRPRCWTTCWPAAGPRGATRTSWSTTSARPCTSSHALPRELFDKGVEAFGDRGVAELMAVIGYYTLVSMTLNAFEVQVGHGMTAPFKREA